MSKDEYILAFEAILYGLIISRILVKWNYMIQDDKPKKGYWAFWVLTIAIFLLIIYVFMMNKIFNHYDKIVDASTFLFYAVFPPGLFTFIVYQIFPREFKNVDLREYLMTYINRVILPLNIYIIFTLFQFAGSITDPGAIVGIVIILFATSVSVFKRYWLLEVYSVLFLLSMIVFGYM
ncbi:hypothetical protein [Ekhidna sp.]